MAFKKEDVIIPDNVASAPQVEIAKERDNTKRLEEKDNALDESITNYQEDVKANNVQPA